MENKEMFRIKEVVINKDGTNVWFYPQYLYVKIKEKGILLWKKKVITERWCNFYVSNNYGLYDTHFGICYNDNDDYENRDKIAGFRNKEGANEVIKVFSEAQDKYSKKWRETYQKSLGSYISDEKHFKVHKFENATNRSKADTKNELNLDNN